MISYSYFYAIFCLLKNLYSTLIKPWLAENGPQSLPLMILLCTGKQWPRTESRMVQYIKTLMMRRSKRKKDFLELLNLTIRINFFSIKVIFS